MTSCREFSQSLSFIGGKENLNIIEMMFSVPIFSPKSNNHPF